MVAVRESGGERERRGGGKYDGCKGVWRREREEVAAGRGSGGRRWVPITKVPG